MNNNWLGYRTRDALQSQTDKISRFFQYNTGGWESWAQCELQAELTTVARSLPRFSDLINLVFDREAGVYANNSRYRCDFLVKSDFMGTGTMPSQNPLEFHAIELKCQSSKETTKSFVSRVETDIDKVKKARLDSGSASVASAWVMAISVDLAGNGVVESEMLAASNKKGISWGVVNLTSDGSIKIWTWSRDFVGHYGTSLFSYSNSFT